MKKKRYERMRELVMDGEGMSANCAAAKCVCLSLADELSVASLTELEREFLQK